MKRVLVLPIFFTILFILISNAYSYVNLVTVSPGATLGQIADAHNTTVASIMSLNGLHNYVIYPGERLKVPSGGSSYRPYRPAPSFGHYTVQFGDTLSLIAQKYGTSIAELRKLNHLYSNVIRQGAVLTVPISNAGENKAAYQAVAYITVSPGATLGQIADAHNTTVASIMSLNGLHNYVIYPGERLKVPSGGSSYRPYRPAPSFGHYTVQFGDTLSLIAQKYGTSIAELRKLNHLYSNVIRQGAVLTVPENYKTYKTAQNNINNAGKNYNYYGNNNFNGSNPNNCKVKNNGSEGRKSGSVNNFGIGKKIVNVAYRYKGVPYVWGGTSDTGMDCSGLIQHVFLKLGIHLPRTAAEQARLGTYVPKDELKPGDLLFFRTYASYISHVGIYIGHGKFIQENSGAGEVTVNSLDDEYFERTYAFAKSIR
ncbi:MAG: LysM peptidoglycan-binding domain-containing protein [Deltaproteobacteria bacterium]|nr:LysM peptidoglycan-binding domain-containing protein [Deltaproteobacteria bacterium]